MYLNLLVKKKMLNIKTKNHPKPLLRWVGGKTQLLDSIKKYYPSKYNTYYEPFLGGGAVFFDLKPRRANLNDINKKLINFYKDIRKNPNNFIKELKKIERKYLPMTELQKKFYYYKIRDLFNSLDDQKFIKSVYFIFLNKTCFNGVYRENSFGKFNVPFGQNKINKLVDEDNIYFVSKLLKNTKITSVSFENVLDNVRKGDLIYLDPPYYPLNNTSNFTKYNDKDFLVDDQLKLYKLYNKLDRNGCYLMLSNSYTPFIRKLYSNYNKKILYTGRAVNCKASGRGKIKEYLILNY